MRDIIIASKLPWQGPSCAYSLFLSTVLIIVPILLWAAVQVSTSLDPPLLATSPQQWHKRSQIFCDGNISSLKAVWTQWSCRLSIDCTDRELQIQLIRMLTNGLGNNSSPSSSGQNSSSRSGSAKRGSYNQYQSWSGDITTLHSRYTAICPTSNCSCQPSLRRKVTEREQSLCRMPIWFQSRQHRHWVLLHWRGVISGVWLGSTDIIIHLHWSTPLYVLNDTIIAALTSMVTFSKASMVEMASSHTLKTKGLLPMCNNQIRHHPDMDISSPCTKSGWKNS